MRRPALHVSSAAASLALSLSLVAGAANDARAEGPSEPIPMPSASPPAASTPPQGVGRPAPRSTPQGVAVLGAGASREAAFTVARALYAGRLRPPSLDEPRARVLAGDPAPEGASRELRELAELRAGVTGSDAASRRVLAAIAEQLELRAVLVVQVDAATATEAAHAAPVARLFLADSGEIDAARYGPEPGVEGALAWRATVSSLERRFLAPAAAAPSGATAATPAAPKTEEGARPFYASGWFWAAVGGAALIGGAIFFVTRDTTADTIHLEMRVPR